jgi:hypothetical protein
MRTLDLDKLKSGLPVISPTFGALYAEAAVVCLSKMGHKSGVTLNVSGDYHADFSLIWTQEIGILERKTWKDLREAAEYAATGIALLIMLELTSYTTFEREEQGQGSDFIMWQWNEEVKNYLSDWASLEISGILEEKIGNSLSMRISKKAQQIAKTKFLNQPAFIAVVEFGKPKAKIVKK